MIYTYRECITIFGTHYALAQALIDKKIFKIKEGLYSTETKPKELEIFVKEHKDAIFTLESAFYYLGLSNVIPDKYYVATDKDASKYKEANVKQFFMNSGLITIGVISINHQGVDVPIFNKERMLIELIRYKNKLPFDYYKEIINYYRNHINDIDIPLVLDYLESFPKKDLITKTIQMEVL